MALLRSHPSPELHSSPPPPPLSVGFSPSVPRGAFTTLLLSYPSPVPSPLPATTDPPAHTTRSTECLNDEDTILDAEDAPRIAHGINVVAPSAYLHSGTGKPSGQSDDIQEALRRMSSANRRLVKLEAYFSSEIALVKGDLSVVMGIMEQQFVKNAFGSESGRERENSKEAGKGIMEQQPGTSEVEAQPREGDVAIPLASSPTGRKRGFKQIYQGPRFAAADKAAPKHVDVEEAGFRRVSQAIVRICVLHGILGDRKIHKDDLKELLEMEGIGHSKLRDEVLLYISSVSPAVLDGWCVKRGRDKGNRVFYHIERPKKVEQQLGLEASQQQQQQQQTSLDT